MKLILDLDAPLADDIRRIVTTRLNDAAHLLRDQPEGIDDAIHDARRHIKQCRALYRLIASEAKSFRKAENQRLGDIGRQLSSLRDAKALLEATAYLSREIPTRSNTMLMNRLAKRLDKRRAEKTEASDKAADILASAEQGLLDAIEAVGPLTLPRSERKSARCLAEGWDKVTRKARAAIDASHDGGDEAFHDLRKRVQDRWMHAILLRDLWPTAMTAIHRQAKMLSDRLGHAQDLSILLEAVSGDSDLVNDAVESEAVRDVVLSQQRKLQDECRAFAKGLFGSKRPRDGKVIRGLLLGR